MVPVRPQSQNCASVTWWRVRQEARLCPGISSTLFHTLLAEQFLHPTLESLSKVRTVMWIVNRSDPEWTNGVILDVLNSIVLLNDLQLCISRSDLNGLERMSGLRKLKLSPADLYGHECLEFGFEFGVVKDTIWMPTHFRTHPIFSSILHEYPTNRPFTVYSTQELIIETYKHCPTYYSRLTSLASSTGTRTDCSRCTRCPHSRPVQASFDWLRCIEPRRGRTVHETREPNQRMRGERTDA
ncbi:hypothetical protein B0H13DRAFT_2147980 [Mycena leptocephala]|nr:hypothetical protein B0H13DRAFT_2147980 [Mycena leptocephala]